MGYIGNNLQAAFSTYKTIDDISGSFNGVTTSFALTVGGVAPVPAPLASNQCLISVGGVVQRPDDTGAEGFRLSGGNIVFSSAPNTGEDFFGVILAGADYVNVGVNFPSGSVSTPSITFDSDLDTGLYNPGANQLGFATAGTNRLTIDASGNINLDSNTLYVDAVNNRVGVSTASPATSLDVNGSCQITGSASGYSGGEVRLGATTADLQHSISTQSTGTPFMFFDHRGTGNTGIFAWRVGTGGASERMRLDASGRLLVGTSTARSTFFGSTVTPQLQLEATTQQASSLSLTNSVAADGGSIIAFGKQRSGAVGGNTIVGSGDELGQISFQGSDGTKHVIAAGIQAFVDGTPGTNDMPGRLVFSTTADGASSPTERMRIYNNGAVACVSTSESLYLSTTVGPGTASGFIYGRYSGTAGTPLSGTTSFLVYTNGNVVNTNNSYGAISDAKLKENIVDAGSQWDDLKALQVRKYNFKEGQTHTQIGLIAQEVELVSPGLVTESPDRDAEGNDLGTVTKSVNYSVLYMKAVKALQEAMERIEQLETEMAAVKAQLL